MRTFTPGLPNSSGADESPALQRMLDDGPGVIHLAPGNYHFGDIVIPQDVTLAGEGPATVIRSNGAKQIFKQVDKTAWAIRDVTLDGQASDDWQQRDDAGECGIFTESCYGFEITGVTLRNFRGVGLQLTQTKLGPTFAHWSNGGMLDRITATGSFIGVRFDKRAEYMNATRLDCSHNVTGCVIHAGNAKIAASNFCSNIDGIYIEDKENGSHGTITNCLVNHNLRMALHARGVRNGMMVTNCGFFYGAIRIEDSVGVTISGSMINCDVKTIGKNANRLADNFIIPAEYKFDLAPATLAEGNYTAVGPWKPGRPRV